MKDLPTPEAFLREHIKNSKPSHEEPNNLRQLPFVLYWSVYRAMEEYATLVRDKTLEVAAENAEADFSNEYNGDRTPYVIEDSILSLKDHPDLQI